MADRLILHYHPGDTVLHRWDGRGKLLAIVTTSALILQDRLPVMIGLSALLPLGWWLGRIPAGQLLREVRSGLWFFLMIVLVYAIFAPEAGGRAIPWVPFSVSGLHQGLWVCWRLFLLLAYAALFSAATSPRELRCAVLWFLTPLRFLPRQRIAFMAGLTIRFVPLVMDELDAIRDAHKARLGALRRNPLRRARYLVLPLFRRVIQRSDDLALALAARGYREDLPLEAPHLPLGHLIPAALLAALWVLGLTL
jgi:biotin transport system permease protein